MTQSLVRKAVAAAAAIGIGVAFAIASAAGASAYQPSSSNLYVSQDSSACNKKPCVLYPKSAQLPSGRIVASFENSKGDPVGQTLPVYKSDDDGTTWQKLTDLQAPAYLSSDSQYAKYTSNWTNPYLYVLPQNVGSLTAGTLLLASVVSGDDYYYKEHKAADSSWTADGDGDRKDVAIALYSSTDDGATWSFQNIIAAGGWSGSRVSNANTYAQSDPVWEPYLVARNGQLVAYYSDEHDYLSYDATTGVPTRDPDDDTATDSYNQILVHKTWSGSSSTSWSSQPVVDVPGTTETLNGKTLIGNGRPGMTTIAQTTDGKWLLTYEYWGGGTNVRYRLADDPLKFYPTSVTDLPITSLPVPSGGHTLSTGGSPVLVTLPDGRILYNANSSGSVWVNESGKSDGTWKEYQTPVTNGYSRNLQYVEGTGRVVILQADFGTGYGPIRYGEVDLGRSTQSAYSTLVNRLTGQVLSPDTGKTQDANLTGNVADLVLKAQSSTDDSQRWHLTTTGSNVTLLNKTGGRSVAIWTGTATAGQKLAQWVDDGATDKQWTLVAATTSGYYKLRSVRNTSLYATGATAGGSVTLASSVDDGSQDWQLVQDPLPTDASFTLKGANSSRCLDVPNGATGVQVQIYDCSGNANQLITQTTAGELRVAGKCLAADGDGTTAGTKLILWTCNGKNSQKWWFRLDGSVINRSNGLAMDVTSWGTANGSKVQLWTALGNATQAWSRN
ncbi:ricin-type beta-trefoil lectin domain protein [Streptomyces sp. NBC_01262]|uniref:ricin-type beta-trefoil lectin domain protein n=1 Tax=Streptomyces sp. NBC_01262 TaxID=2903803 RepID=UPI002E375155|nr:ricin-type beta-trefoil lectin domain protein [Streptomyces sp. NBC_01262]